jgi:hypothetical protein
MEATNAQMTWAQAKVRELLRDCVSWALLCALAELGISPPP